MYFPDLDYRQDILKNLLSEKDIYNIGLGIKNGIHIVTLSSVESAADVQAARQVVAQAGNSEIQLYSKIQSREGLAHFDEILTASDGIIIARGYLGMALEDIDDVVYVQTYIINKCNTVGKPVVLQTQIMDSMIHRLRPTRSEVCDIAHAVNEGVDAMILSAETAVGCFYKEATSTMAKICIETESNLDYVKRYFI